MIPKPVHGLLTHNTSLKQQMKKLGLGEFKLTAKGTQPHRVGSASNPAFSEPWAHPALLCLRNRESSRLRKATTLCRRTNAVTVTTLINGGDGEYRGIKNKD